VVARLGLAATDDAPPDQCPLGLSDHGALLLALVALKERPKLGYTWANVWPGTIYA
jgi:hypothetical protein